MNRGHIAHKSINRCGKRPQNNFHELEITPWDSLSPRGPTYLVHSRFMVPRQSVLDCHAPEPVPNLTEQLSTTKPAVVVYPSKRVDDI
ncbi:hypothetical protein EVAR_53257_1 [Eumeta japonica]|uniref:Uncharacterized protein n=1 Tax=Eumeta variegata TaxID=151549 RepID=A0A4C1YM81_EUMVA|nr:hypothetical protein EVAR_53257_1 [Eumeta japonica]